MRLQCMLIALGGACERGRDMWEVSIDVRRLPNGLSKWRAFSSWRPATSLLMKLT